ncbi:MAG: CHC2 zinc finger domain-containing protein [bacterium]
MISKCKNELHDKEVSRDEKINTLEIWIENREGAQKGKEIFFLCPFHNDHNPSCRWNPEKEVWYCDPCGKGGGWRELYEKLEKEILSAENKCTPARAYENNNTSSKLESACCFPAECSLDSYVSEKQISKAVLETFGLSDFEYQGKPSIKVPYYGESGEELSVRYRINLHGKNRFLWKKGSKPYPMDFGS